MQCGSETGLKDRRWTSSSNTGKSDCGEFRRYWNYQKTDRVPALQTFHGSSRSTQLSAELTKALNDFSQQEGVTLFMTLLAAFQVLLSRYSSQEDIVVGSPIAGRNQEDVERLIGFFVNTLMLRTDLSGNPSFRELLERVKEVALGAYANQELPFEKLVDELQPERSLSYAPLFQVMFVLQNAPRTEFKLSGLTLSRMRTETETSKFDLTLFATENAGSLRLAFEYNTDLFDDARIERMLEHLRIVLESFAREPETRIAALEILTSAERRQVLVDWNETTREFAAKPIHELFEEQVKRSPEDVAVIFETEEVTYGELNRRANQLAHYLKKQGVGPEVLVGVCVERSLEMVVALLGIMKAGGAYVPLDPTYPQDRLELMIDDSGIQVLLTQQRLREMLSAYAVPSICLDDDWTRIASESEENPAVNIGPGNLAYVIYTSGSTGRPKGVQISHSALTNFLSSMRERPGLSASDVLLAVTTLSFDIAGLELYLPLIVGARLVIARREEVIDGVALVQLINQSRATVMQATPATWRLLIEAGWNGDERLRILCGGEALTRQLADQLLERCAELWNMYGPTETTIWSTIEHISSRAGTIVIGKPIANTQVYLLDKNFRPVPLGVDGELYIGGAGLARGYEKRPDLTAERFIPDPFSDGGRLYRTGDLARYSANGNIEYLGRTDNQVKLRGFRIELGEIEQAINEHAQVREAVVIVREDEPGDRRLVAYVVPEEPGLNVNDLRDYLRRKLPEYMLPAATVEMAEFPLTPNGKVDRRALPAPQLSRSDLETGFQGPRTPTEETIAAIWSEILKVDPIGVHENFFHLGGHSLLAVRVMSRIRVAFGAELPLRSFFESPTIAGCADRIEETMRGARRLQQPPLVRASREGDLPLSFAQQRLWFLNQLEADSAFYNVPIARRLRGRLNIDALQKALESLTLRHEALRTNFAAIDGTPVQVITQEPGLAFSVIDLRHVQDVEAEIERVSGAEAALPFDLSSDPLLRVKVLRLGEEESVLLITMHHIVSDGWSMEVLMRELAAFYEAFSTGTTAQLPELPIQYADYSVWQREWLESDSLDQQLSYWINQLHGIPSVFELPKDRPRPPVQSYRGRMLSVDVPTALAQQVNEFSRQEGVTLFTTLLAALQTLMWRYTGQHDVVVGTPVANRNQREIEGLIGFFANTLVLRSDLSGSPTFRELLTRVREVVVNALANQDLPFERLVDELQPERSLSRTPLFQVNFTLQNVRQGGTLKGLQMERVWFEKTTSKFDLTLTAVERADNLGLTVEYNTDLFDDVRMERLLNHYQTLLAGIVANPATKISHLPILTDNEREQLLVDWNETAISYGETKCIHELVSEQAERVPGAPAVVFGEKQLTYRELDQRANQVARYLRKRGVGAESLVAICVNRSPEMVVGLLGVLKAGGAYLPVDPKHPQDLMSYILGDADASILLTEESLRSKLPETSAELICVDSGWNEIEKETDAAFQNTAGADNLAYVIYTSGSTGKPRGVMVTHRGLSNYLNWAMKAYGVSEGSGSLVHSPLGFDLTVTSLLLPLVAGQRVTLLREDEGIEELGLALSAGVDHSLVKLTPSHLEGLSHLLPRNASGKTRALVVGGEALFGERMSFWRTAAPDTRIFNEYGPTETVVGCCVYEVAGEQKTGPVPIGKPVANTSLYVLDNQWQPMPVGVPGELFIGGVGVARGYVNKPDLTADKFIPDPFSDTPGQRLYRTGDIVRHLEDGNLEYIGRTDHQVKLRGYRIELGEIEAVLNSHPQVREAVVLAREDEPGNKRLVGYIAPQLDGLGSTQTSEFETEQVSDWQEVFNESYGNAQSPADPKFNIVGWNSSYTGEPIPADEMREWVDRTVERILALEPKRVLEIGCGSGLLLFRVAPHCEKYHGTDLSQAALNELQKHVAAAGQEFANVTLSRQQAGNLTHFKEGEFDTIVLNSVVQYFPSAEYLVNLLKDAVRVVRPGGSIFLGDLRSLPLLKAFSTSIQVHNAPDEMGVSELRLRIEKQIAQEKELVIDPAFFIDLKRQISEIGTVEVQLKQAHFPNELSKFRYDVTLRVGNRALPQVRSKVLHWQGDGLDLERFRRLLADERPENLIVREIPNQLLAPEFKAMTLLGAKVRPQTVRELRRALQRLDADSAVNPEDIWSFNRELPYSLQLRSSRAGAYDSFDVVLRRKDSPFAEVLPELEVVDEEQTLSYTNNPLRAKGEQSLLPGLRQLLKEKLPEHMALSDFVFLPELPLTYNGKIDRSALPAPDQSRSESEHFQPPQTDIERQLADIWTEVLRRKEVGRNDNFFRLGGHSLLATQIVSRVRERFRIQFPLRRIFEFPTVAEMAVAVGQAQQEGKAQPQLEMISKRRDASTLLKNIDNLSAEQIDSLLSEVLGK